MRIDEFDNPRLNKMIAATDQLSHALNTGLIKTNWTLDLLSEYFRKFDIILSPQDFYDMIQTKPLNNIIQNIEGNEVIFKGIPQKKKPVESPPPEQSKEIVAKMAKKAQSK